MIMRYIKCIYKRVRILFDIDEMKHITTDHEKCLGRVRVVKNRMFTFYFVK